LIKQLTYRKGRYCSCFIGGIPGVVIGTGHVFLDNLGAFDRKQCTSVYRQAYAHKIIQERQCHIFIKLIKNV